MGLAVVGAGFGRTGTMSLKIALEKLGYGRCYHMSEVLKFHPKHMKYWAAAHRGERVDWNRLFEGYQAAVDWPSCGFWRELSQYYPESKVILTKREAKQWHESVLRTIYPAFLAMRASDDAGWRATADWINFMVYHGFFDDRIEDETHALRLYHAHNQAVEQSVPSHRLLVMDGEQTWEPLCGFFGCPVPDEPYPVLNTSEEFLANSGSTVTGFSSG
ncbi:MAG: sulfotransferase family protein [Deltaproteobacteria bacterium]|nr:sulfotransferase family protein [Deltaproteobacteria bacterium]MBF0509306.1 sulfotransferase family protein [Deltaproteobacteria bacterium]MBF0526110.1 sulfotransferase family protein [Deltaproteobacteria bacterium]